MTLEAGCQVPVERDGAVITVFLPGCTDRPRPNYVAAGLPLTAGGRLMVSAALRRQTGSPDRADVLALLDRDQFTVTLTAASRLDASLTAALDGLRRTPPGAAAEGLAPASWTRGVHDDAASGRVAAIRVS